MAPIICRQFPSPAFQIQSLAPLKLSLSSSSAWTDRNMRSQMPSWDLLLDLRMPRGRFQGSHRRWAWIETFKMIFSSGKIKQQNWPVGRNCNQARELNHKVKKGIHFSDLLRLHKVGEKRPSWRRSTLWLRVRGHVQMTSVLRGGGLANLWR